MLTMAISKAFYLLFLLLPLTTTSLHLPQILSKTPATSCHESCDIKFCDDSKTIIIFGNDVAYEKAICRYGLRLKNAQSSEAFSVDDKGVRTKVSDLKGEIPPTVFKTLRLTLRHGVGIGVQRVGKAGLSAMNGRCFQLPVRRFSFGARNGMVRNVDGGRRDCIGFSVFVPVIGVEATWDSKDDLDLHVREPDGADLFYMRPLTDSGELLRDAAAGRCEEKMSGGREGAVYGRTGAVIAGVYRAHLSHFDNCGEVRTKWRLRVFVRGILVGETTGISNGDRGQVIEESYIRFIVRQSDL